MGVTTEEVYRALYTWQDTHPYGPSVRDLGRSLDLSYSAVYHHLLRLKASHRVTWEDGIDRTYRVAGSRYDLSRAKPPEGGYHRQGNDHA